MKKPREFLIKHSRAIQHRPSKDGIGSQRLYSGWGQDISAIIKSALTKDHPEESDENCK